MEKKSDRSTHTNSTESAVELNEQQMMNLIASINALKTPNSEAIQAIIGQAAGNKRPIEMAKKFHFDSIRAKLAGYRGILAHNASKTNKDFGDEFECDRVLLLVGECQKYLTNTLLELNKYNSPSQAEDPATKALIHECSMLLQQYSPKDPVCNWYEALYKKTAAKLIELTQNYVTEASNPSCNTPVELLFLDNPDKNLVLYFKDKRIQNIFKKSFSASGELAEKTEIGFPVYFNCGVTSRWWGSDRNGIEAAIARDWQHQERHGIKSACMSDFVDKLKAKSKRQPDYLKGLSKALEVDQRFIIEEIQSMFFKRDYNYIDGTPLTEVISTYLALDNALKGTNTDALVRALPEPLEGRMAFQPVEPRLIQAAVANINKAKEKYIARLEAKSGSSSKKKNLDSTSAEINIDRFLAPIIPFYTDNEVIKKAYVSYAKQVLIQVMDSQVKRVESCKRNCEYFDLALTDLGVLCSSNAQDLESELAREILKQEVLTLGQEYVEKLSRAVLALQQYGTSLNTNDPEQKKKADIINGLTERQMRKIQSTNFTQIKTLDEFLTFQKEFRQIADYTNDIAPLMQKRNKVAVYLANILICLTGVGSLFLLGHYARTKRLFFEVDKTNSSKALDLIKDQLSDPGTSNPNN